MTTGPEQVIAQRQHDLREQMAASEAELVAVREARSDSTADDEHDPEGPTLAVEWSRIEGRRAETRRELAALEGALARVAAGTYGVCVSCGAPIPAERLALRPAADRCVPCASRS